MFHFNKNMTKWLQPKYFFLGILLGFSLCCVSGRIISHHARFQHFKRFFSAISPQMQYYPTAHELLMTLRHEVDHDKTLVLIGGSSILRGVGQNPDELWSDELQRLLGDKFKVINYGMDSANMTSFAGVVFRIIKDDYPKIIFISTCYPVPPSAIEGMDTYSYLFWEAYYKGLIQPNLLEKNAISAMRSKQFLTAKGIEQQALSYLDSLFYFRNLWNWVGYRLAFTVWTDIAPTSSFRPRRYYRDENNINIKKQIEAVDNDRSQFQSSVDVLARIVALYVNPANTNLPFYESELVKMRNSLNDAYARYYRSNILCLVPSENPKYLSALPENFQHAHSLVLNKFNSILQAQGYAVLMVGQDFSPEDYADARHFAAAGGRKIASQVAKQVKNIAVAKGILATS